MKLEADLLVENAAQVVTARALPEAADGAGKLGIIPDGTVAVKDGRIVWTGPAARATRLISLLPGGKELDASGRVVLPGFIDSHTHLLFAGTREEEFEMRLRGASYQEIAARGGGIKSTVEKTRRASREELWASGKRNLDTMLSLGTTTVEAKTGYGLSTQDEIKMLEVLAELGREHPLEVVPTFLGAHEVPPEYGGKTEDYVRLVIEEMIPAVAEKKLARFCDVFCEKGVFSPDQSRRILAAGKRFGLIPKVHADELTPLGGAELAAEMGAASADHLLFVSEEGMEAMARKGVVATLLPGTAFFLFLGRYAPAREMISRGVTVALATDFNPGSCMTQSLPLITTLACTQMRMTPAEAIAAATINAAYALGRADRVSSLAVGKFADLAFFAVEDYREIPYYFGVNHCTLTLKRGQVVWNHR